MLDFEPYIENDPYADDERDYEAEKQATLEYEDYLYDLKRDNELTED